MRKYKIKDESGNRYGRLIVVRVHSRAITDKSRQTMWLCQCDCGNEVISQIGALRRGATKSCGCYIKELTKAKFNIRTLQKQALRYLKQGAKDRNLLVTLSDDEFLNLMQQKCFYCGAENTNRIKERGRIWRYNGVDRVKNDQGYIENNCVSCCRNCNRAKDVMTQQEFINLAHQITKLHPILTAQESANG